MQDWNALYDQAPAKCYRIRQHRTEIVPFYQFVEVYQPCKSVLEIGTAWGGNLYLLAHLAQKLVVGVDLDNQRSKVTATQIAEAIRDEQLPCESAFIQGLSQEAATIEAVKQHAPYDLIFIDGDHHYGPAKQDYDNFSAMLTPNGIIALHDIRWGAAPTPEGVCKLWGELKRGHITVEFCSNPREQGAMGIGVILK